MDEDTSVLWSRTTSDGPLEIDAALGFCAGMGDGWRLPNRAELNSIFEGSEKVEERDIKPFLAASLPDPGTLWSGQDVSAKRAGEKWAVNLYNGQFYNGAGEQRFARCVHGKELVLAPNKFPSDVPYDASQGDADAKTTWILFCQYDYPCKKLAPILDEIVASHSLRVVWKQWVLSDYARPASLALCAATRQGKWTAMHSKLIALSSDKPSAEEVKELAKSLELDLSRFDRDVADACEKGLDANNEEARRLELEGTASLVVDGEVFNPLRNPERLQEAIKSLPAR